MAVHMIVVGSGRMGAELAYRLFEKHCDVTVIDQVASAFQNLDPGFRGRMLEGDVLSQDMLHRTGIEHATGVAAVTSSDSLNAVIAHIARHLYKVPHVVVRNYDPRWLPLYEAFDLQVISSSSWGAQRIEELLLPGVVHTVFSAGNGEVEIYELRVPQAWHGKPLQDILPESRCAFVALTRAGRAMLPGAHTLLQEDDILHLSATPDGIEDVRQRLTKGKEA